MPASASQQHPSCLSRVKSDSLPRLSRFWKTLPSLLKDPGLGSAPGLEQRQALGAQCGWSCVDDMMLMAPVLSVCSQPLPQGSDLAHPSPSWHVSGDAAARGVCSAGCSGEV